MRAQLTILLLTLTLGTAAHAQGIAPESYNIHHSDSCWYVTMNYRIAQMPKDDEGESYEDMVSGGGREF